MAQVGNIVKSQPIELRSSPNIESTASVPLKVWQLCSNTQITPEHVLYWCFSYRHALEV